MTKMSKRGAVEILCREIEFDFSKGMETPRVIVAFTRQLVIEIAVMRDFAERIGVKRPSIGSGELLDKVLYMLNGDDIPSMVKQCTALHSLAHELNPSCAYPTDHLVDMLSSCISAIRFGCDTGFAPGSRHAVEAANHIWRKKYGASLFDDQTPRWQKDWSRHILTRALVSMALPVTRGAYEET